MKIRILEFHIFVFFVISHLPAVARTRDGEELPHGGQSELDLGGLLASSDSAPPFVTTKVASYGPNAYMWKAEEDATAGVIAEFEGCKERLGLSTVDCLILHWPGPPQEGRSDGSS